MEGFSKFNILARALAFLDNCKNVYYYDFLCGEDDLSIAQINVQCFMTICSVWHHIQHKEKFLAQLKQINLKYIFGKMAVREECYDGHSWEQEVDTIIRTLGFAAKLVVGYSSDYNRLLILISKDFLLERQKKKVAKMAKSIFKLRGSRRIRNFLKG